MSKKIIWNKNQLHFTLEDIKSPALSPLQVAMVQCQICLMLLQAPTECAACQNQFCEDCVKTWMDKQKQMYKFDECPFRCKPFKQQKSHKFVRELLSELRIECPNTHAGCQELLVLDRVEGHQSL